MLCQGRATLVRTIPAKAEKGNILASMIIEQCQAVSADDAMAGAPWSIEGSVKLDEYRALRVRSAWVQGRKGITTDLNGVFFVDVMGFDPTTSIAQIRTRPGKGKTDIGAEKTVRIEATLLYPLLKGAGDFSLNQLHIKQQLYAIVPNGGIDRAALNEAQTKLNLPGLAKTRRYFDGFRQQLKARSTFRRYLAKQNAHHAVIFNVGQYTFAPWKVVWPEIGNFRAVVVGSADTAFGDRRPVVPDHKLYFAAFHHEIEAYFLCGILNCSVVRSLIQGQNVGLQVGDVFKHFDPPRFDQTDRSHLRLAASTRAAHRTQDEAIRGLATSRAEVLALHILRTECARRALA